MAKRLIIKVGNVCMNVGEVKQTDHSAPRGPDGTQVLNAVNSVSIVETVREALKTMTPVGIFTSETMVPENFFSSKMVPRYNTTLVLVPHEELRTDNSPVPQFLVDYLLNRCTDLHSLCAYTHEDGTAVVYGHVASKPSEIPAAQTLTVSLDDDWTIAVQPSADKLARDAARLAKKKAQSEARKQQKAATAATTAE